jgi:hypothetical protein
MPPRIRETLRIYFTETVFSARTQTGLRATTIWEGLNSSIRNLIRCEGVLRDGPCTLHHSRSIKSSLAALTNSSSWQDYLSLAACTSFSARTVK